MIEIKLETCNTDKKANSSPIFNLSNTHLNNQKNKEDTVLFTDINKLVLKLVWKSMVLRTAKMILKTFKLKESSPSVVRLDSQLQ